MKNWLRWRLGFAAALIATVLVGPQVVAGQTGPGTYLSRITLSASGTPPAGPTPASGQIASVFAPLVQGTPVAVTAGTPSFSTLTLTGACNAASGAVGFAASLLCVGDGTSSHNLVSTDQTQTETNKTMTSPVFGGTATGTLTLGTPLAVGSGGTGVGTLATHGVVIGQGAGTVAVTAAGTSGQCLTSNGASLDPTYQSCTAITLPVSASNGGTGASTLTSNACLVGNGTAAIQQIASGYGYTCNTAAVALTTATAQLAADVLLNNTANYFDGPSVSLAAGTWYVHGFVDLIDTAGAAGFTCKLWDGTTVFALGGGNAYLASRETQISIAWVVSPGSTTTYKISCKDGISTSGSIRAQTDSLGNHASSIVALRQS